MKITLVRNLEETGKDETISSEIVHRSKTLYNIADLTRGYKLESIKLNIEFTAKDIPELIEFLNNSLPCFKIK